MLSRTVLFGVILSVFSTYTQGYKPCIDAPKTPLNEDWFIKAAAIGFLVVEHSDCNNCEKKEAWSWLRATGRTIPKKMCWNMHVTTPFGAYVLPLNCKYYNIAKQECELDFSHSDLKDKVQWGGSVVITKTDNATYVAGTYCIFGKENFWFISTTNPDKTLPPGVQDEIEAEFTKMGFQTDNLAKNGTSVLYLGKLNSEPQFCL